MSNWAYFIPKYHGSILQCNSGTTIRRLWLRAELSSEWFERQGILVSGRVLLGLALFSGRILSWIQLQLRGVQFDWAIGLSLDGGGGLVAYSGTVNQGDSVLLSLYFSGGVVFMYSLDWNTSATAIQDFSATGREHFFGVEEFHHFPWLFHRSNDRNVPRLSVLWAGIQSILHQSQIVAHRRHHVD